MPESEPALRTVLAELQRDAEPKLLVKAFADAREANGDQLSWERAPRGGLAGDTRNSPRAPRTKRLRFVSRPLGWPHRTGVRGDQEGRTRSDLEVGGLRTARLIRFSVTSGARANAAGITVYSARNAMTGSIRAARHAGTMDAIVATRPTANATVR